MNKVTIRNDGGKALATVPCHGVRVHLGAHYLDLALHHWKEGSRWCVTDPLSGIRLFTFDWTPDDAVGAKVVARYKIGRKITGEDGDLVDELYQYRRRFMETMAGVK